MTPVHQGVWPLAGRRATTEVLLVWGLAFGSLVLAFLAFGLSSATKLVATTGFLYLPILAMRGRGEDLGDYGLSLRHWRQDLKLFFGLSLLIAPLFFAAYWGFLSLLPHLPDDLAALLSPYRPGADVRFTPRLPPDFGQWVLDQTLVVALPEEFFYRGFIQTRLRDAWPGGRRLFGARLGPALVVTALLFALGHLAIFAVWRLSVFFPGLLFGWMREKTGTILGATLLHAAANLFVRFLDVSFAPVP